MKRGLLKGKEMNDLATCLASPHRIVGTAVVLLDWELK